MPKDILNVHTGTVCVSGEDVLTTNVIQALNMVGSKLVGKGNCGGKPFHVEYRIE